MGGKFSPIIIIVLLIVVIAIGYLGYQLIMGGPVQQKPDDPGIVDEKIVPVLELSKDEDEEGNVKIENGAVKIRVSATTEDEEGIDYIKLPDGSIFKGVETVYEVSENNTYEFSVVGINGEVSTSDIVVTEIPEASSTNPYIPEGFKVVDETSSMEEAVDNGFIIMDDYGNQFVWVPVPSGKLTRINAIDTNYDENNESANLLVNSVSKNYGFYIGRFEASLYNLNGKEVAASMMGEIPWTNVTCQEAMEYASNSGFDFGYNNNIRTSLINSYAWDTTLAWLEEKYPEYSTSNSYGNFEGTILLTGATQKDILRNICDLSGNVREWTTERYIGIDREANSKNNKNNQPENIIYRVLRSGSANLSRTPSSSARQPENNSGLFWGFRVILFQL